MKSKFDFSSFKGSHLKEMHYTPLFPYFANVRLVFFLWKKKMLLSNRYQPLFVYYAMIMSQKIVVQVLFIKPHILEKMIIVFVLQMVLLIKIQDLLFVQLTLNVDLLMKLKIFKDKM
jgi:hypothetical protein